VLNLAPFNTTL